MIILNSIDSDILSSIHDGSFPLPDLSSKLYISKKTTIDHGQVAAIGLIRLTCEGILLTNNDLPLITRARASAAIIEALKKDAKNMGLQDCHVFVNSINTKKFLEHLDFKMCPERLAMSIQF